MPQQVSSTTSAVHYRGERRGNVIRPSKGSGKTVKIMDDLRSPLVHELVEQLNEARISEKVRATVANTATVRVPLATSVNGKYIEEVLILSGASAALSNAATDIKIAVASAGDIDLESGPSSPVLVFHAEGFNSNNFPAQSQLKASEITSDDTDALTVAWTGPIILAAGEVLYAEVINTEGASINIDFTTETAVTDRLSLQPDDLSRAITLPNRRYSRKTGRTS